MSAFIELHYLPSIAWCAALWPQKSICLEANEHYSKGSYRNRCHIAGPNGLQRLSIPLLKGKHQQTPIREVRISYQEAWQRQHWRSITTAYSASPYFEHYRDGLESIFTQKPTFLFDWNLLLLEHVLIKRMGWKGEITFSTAYSLPGSPPEKLDFRNAICPGDPDPDWFFAARYGQLFQERHGFMPNLSVLDLLFCQGKNGAAQLQRGYMV
jgi:WbqC-like protein family